MSASMQHPKGMSLFPGSMPTVATGAPQPRASAPTSIPFFVCDIMIIVIASKGCFWYFWQGSFVDCMHLFYIGIVGYILALVDRPCKADGRTLTHWDLMLGHYFNAITRLTHKGVITAILGCGLRLTMFSKEKVPSNRVAEFFLSWYIVIIGIISVSAGISKSYKLNEQRIAIIRSCPQGVDNQIRAVIGSYAVIYPEDKGPQFGLTPHEFKSFSYHFCKTSWSSYELNLIFNALQSRRQPYQDNGELKMPLQNLTLVDITNWLAGGYVPL